MEARVSPQYNMAVLPSRLPRQMHRKRSLIHVDILRRPLLHHAPFQRGGHLQAAACCETSRRKRRQRRGPVTPGMSNECLSTFLRSRLHSRQLRKVRALQVSRVRQRQVPARRHTWTGQSPTARGNNRNRRGNPDLWWLSRTGRLRRVLRAERGANDPPIFTCRNLRHQACLPRARKAPPRAPTSRIPRSASSARTPRLHMLRLKSSRYRAGRRPEKVIFHIIAMTRSSRG